MANEVRGISETVVTLRSEVYQSNVFLQAKKDFDLMGMRLFLIALSGINPHFSSKDKFYDENFKQMFFPTSKLSELLGNSKYLGLIPKACLKLELASVKLADNDDSDSKLVNLFKKIDYKPREGLYVCFNDKLRPYLLDLLYAKEGYTKLKVCHLLCLTSLYAVRLLELLLQYQNIRHYKEMMEIERRFSIKELRFMLNVPKWAYKSRIDNFRKHVLDIPMKEINDHTPYVLRYKVIKKGKKTIAFKFMLGTHNVPIEIKGKAPEFSNDAINYLRELGFTDGAARAIFYKCKDVLDCVLRTHRAQALLQAQKTPIRNRLGFLRKAIENDWRLNTMVDKEDPYSKPGWSAKIDYHSRRSGKPLRAPKRKIDRPPNVFPATKMDKELADAITQGKFYTSVAVTEKMGGKKEEENVGQVSKAAIHPVAVTEKMSGKKEEENVGQVSKATIRPVAVTEKMGGKKEEENVGQTSEAASRLAAAAENILRDSAVVTSGGWSLLDNVIGKYLSDVARQRLNALKAREAAGETDSSNGATEVLLQNNPQEENYYRAGADKLAKLKSQHYNSLEERYEAVEQDFEEEMAELAAKKARERELSKKMQLARQQSLNETASSPPTAPQNNSPSKMNLSDGFIKLIQTYKQVEQNVTALEKAIAQECEDDLKARAKALQERKLAEQNGTAKVSEPVSPPPRPKRNINLPLPPPPPPEFKKDERRSKKDKLLLKSIEEIEQLYTKANELNEEPESILARTNSPDVKAFEYEKNELTEQEYIYLNGTRFNRRTVDDHLVLCEIPEVWRGMLEFFVDVNMTVVEGMRRYIKTFGSLPTPYVFNEKQLTNYRRCHQNIYTGKFQSTIDPTKPPQPVDPKKLKRSDSDTKSEQK